MTVVISDVLSENIAKEEIKDCGTAVGGSSLRWCGFLAY